MKVLEDCVCLSLLQSPSMGQSLRMTLQGLRPASSHASGPGIGWRGTEPRCPSDALQIRLFDRLCKPGLTLSSQSLLSWGSQGGLPGWHSAFGYLGYAWGLCYCRLSGNSRPSAGKLAPRPWWRSPGLGWSQSQLAKAVEKDGIKKKQNKTWNQALLRTEWEWGAHYPHVGRRAEEEVRIQGAWA